MRRFCFSHGTRCAGAAAGKANNEICGVGVAYGASISGQTKKNHISSIRESFTLQNLGIRLLDGPITTLLEARALTMFDVDTDIKSSSWG